MLSSMHIGNRLVDSGERDVVYHLLRVGATPAKMSLRLEPRCTKHPQKEIIMSQLTVALYWPNILCYARILLAFVGLGYASSRPWIAVSLWIGSAFLDLFDGMLARMLNQTSKLGVLLDIAADNILRTNIWIAVAIVTDTPCLRVLAVVTICTEWITMLLTQLHSIQSGEHWKKTRDNDPWLVKAFFANNFRNPLGTLGIIGLFSANLFLFGAHFPSIHSRIPGFDLFLVLSCSGRLLSFTVELWLCFGYLSFLLGEDVQEVKQQSKP